MAVTEAKRRDGPGFSALPEGCIASVVSFTSPSDACRLASVSPVFKSACDSDAVWASFLPPDWHPMVSRCASSLKELYFSLCDDPVLVNDGKLSFSLDRHSGKKCIMLSARALSITGGDTRSNWSWNHMPNSRFAEVAELMEAYRLEIRGTISPRMLSTRTLYAAYLVFKLSC
ncbi:F-box protein At2g02240-like [Syzygium oleosum]|uniref:F-box protein At2g02240-like n=1 Tax=Syzygium oleosum TaxID=219896 RepID=UPI0024B884A3|nr:F-box protein At2g02240-like [Syzygium oleosum]